MPLKQIFIQLMNQFKTSSDYQKYLSDCQKKFQLKVYRVNTLTKAQALQYYQFLTQKYQRGIYQIQRFSWYQNERRLFIWFIICFMKYQGNQSLQNEENWQFISKQFFNKDIKFLKYQYMNIQRKSNRVYWKEEQDDVLRQAFIKYGQSQWNQIAKHVYFSGVSHQFKSPKNCRQRWNNHLNEKIKKDPWTDQQDYLLLVFVKQNGRKWSSIAKNMQGKRTQHQIKNRYNSLLLHCQKDKNIQQKIVGLIETYKKKLQNSKNNSFHNIIIKQQQSTLNQSSQKIQQNINFHRKTQQPFNYRTKSQFDKQALFHSYSMQQQKYEKKQCILSGGMSIIYSGNEKNPIENGFFNSLDKLFVSGSQFFSDKSQLHNLDLERSIIYTPTGYQIFDDNNNSTCQKSKKCGDFKFIQQIKAINNDKNEFSQSMQFLKAAKLDLSQDMKFLISSNSDLFHTISHDFHLQMKQI